MSIKKEHCLPRAALPKESLFLFLCPFYQNMAEKKSARKARYWAFLVYPDSAPTGWVEILEDTGLEIAISPLHDRDTWTAADALKNPDLKPGTSKKAHWHVIICFDGPTTAKNVAEITHSVNGTSPIVLYKVAGNYKYFTHDTDKAKKADKVLYDEKDICCLNGFNIRNYCELDKSEIDEKVREIEQLCCDREIFEYHALIDALRDENTDLHDIASKHTCHLGKYLDSRRHAATEAEKSTKREKALRAELDAVTEKYLECLRLIAELRANKRDE